MNLSQAFGVEVEALFQRWHESVALGELFSHVSNAIPADIRLGGRIA
jgi:hypothetical protein